MNYEYTVKGEFLSRPNRFIALVKIGRRTETCHVKNTGRCRELLIPGARVILEYHPDAAASGRKTSYDLIAVYKEVAGVRRETLLINMDSQAPNLAAWEWVNAGGLEAGCFPEPIALSNLRREVAYGSSRLDLAFHLTRLQNSAGSPAPLQALMEVKGVTLESAGLAAFPDAPTQRGIKHLEELTAASRKGICCFLLFVIQMKGISSFHPNMETHPEFGLALAKAKEAGVRILARDCLVTPNSMKIDQPVPVLLPPLPA